uniref:Uncharacterized protein n=1 Tax=Arundo donax TaxID=35708 RepID=A0A0A8YJM1_ARUDO
MQVVFRSRVSKLESFLIDLGRYLTHVLLRPR